MNDRATAAPSPDLFTLDAWLDGDPVSRPEVAALLATDEGRAYAIDVMALRRMMQVDAPVLVQTRPGRWRAVAAAAAILLTSAGGFVAGQYATRSDDGADDVTAASPSSPAPAPTRVIQFEVGVDWRESSGGN